MVSVRRTLLALASALAVSADYYVNPNSVPINTRNEWCTQEIQTCPLICLQSSSGAKINTCNATTLQYGCLCNDNKQPNLSEYSLTLPYFVCTEWVSQCQASCSGNSACAACAQDHPCGAQNPSRVNTSTMSAMPSTATGASPTAGQIFTGLGGAGATDTPTAGTQSAAVRMRMLELGSVYGTATMIVGLLAGFLM